MKLWSTIWFGFCSVVFSLVGGIAVCSAINYDLAFKLVSDNEVPKDGKFVQVPTTKLAGGGFFRIDEYVTPAGAPGYQTFYYDDQMHLLGTNAFGPEEQERTTVLNDTYVPLASSTPL